MFTVELMKGSVLIISSWTLFLLCTLAIYLGAGILQKINLVKHLDTIDSLHLIAEAGVNTALSRLVEVDPTPSYDTLNEPWSNNPQVFKGKKIGRGEFNVGYDYVEDKVQKTRYGLIDEEGKVNINTSDSKVLERLIIQLLADVSENEALELALCIVDWRDSDSFYQHPVYGAEDSDYKDLEEPYEAKDSDFEILDELLLVKGITRERYDRIKDYMTIYGSGRVNINTAQIQVLLSLGLSAATVDKIAAFRNSSDKASGTSDDGFFSSPEEITKTLKGYYTLGGSEEAEINSLVDRGILSASSSYFMIKSTAVLENSKAKTTIVAVADRNRNIKYWREE